jgi:hypothetical protein
MALSTPAAAAVSAKSCSWSLKIGHPISGMNARNVRHTGLIDRRSCAFSSCRFR